MSTSAVSIENQVEKLAAATKGGVDISAERCVPNLVVAVGYPVVDIPNALFDVGYKGGKIRSCCGMLGHKALNVVYLMARRPVVAIATAGSKRAHK